MTAEKLHDLETRLAMVEAKLAALEAAAKAKPEAGLPTVNLDSEHGDPVVRKDPPRWPGDTFVGKRYSDCTPEYLESLAGFLAWKAKKNDADGKTKYAEYDRLDAARAQGWAARIRAGHGKATATTEAARYGTSGHGANAKHTAPADTDGFDGVDDIPF